MIKTRYAPSPTGDQHIGGIRTALFSWMFARHNNGKFILRIEDTDQKRLSEGSTESILKSLEWFGIDYDEAPYFQSDNLDKYHYYAHYLIKLNKAYKSEGAIRFNSIDHGFTYVNDIVLGKTKFNNNQVKDAVLLKSDGFPTYHLAHIVDDHLMEISHVIRSNEWFNSLPLHIQIWDAFGWDKPQFAHLPVLLNPNGKGKLSKRHQNTGDIPVLVSEFRKAGYLPEAVLNFLMNIGWTFGDDREIFSPLEAIERFKLEDVHQSNSAYPIEKLKWINKQYIQSMDANRLLKNLKNLYQVNNIEIEETLLARSLSLLRDRMKTLNDAIDIMKFTSNDFSSQKLLFNELNISSEQIASILRDFLNVIKSMDKLEYDVLNTKIKEFVNNSSFENKTLYSVLRIATTSQESSPPIFDIVKILGKEEIIHRIDVSINKLEK